ncbi:PQQ-dependent sugar dehydrogenase [Agrobacterium sp. ES01]|uniref:PQQ-dependent sugar dehydrogenase n=1 Tax=Agrobacterium sp. ES01 TaxID=3420714 RepID=UPI003D134B6E
MSELYARLVALIGAAMIVIRRFNKPAEVPAIGGAPIIPEAKSQGPLPTLKMPTAKGWENGRLPVAAPGLKVNALAMGLKHPRWMHVLPNGDVLVSEALGLSDKPKSPFDYAMQATMRRAAALGESANRITLLRDADGDGVAEVQTVYRDKLHHPFGMAMLDDTLYIGNTDALVAFPYVAGATKLEGEGRKLADYKPAGHWTRSILPSKDGRYLYVGVGSLSNIGDNGLEAEEGRAAIHVHDRQTGENRIFASGLRNPVGLAFEPSTDVLWTVVNERDGIGDETPPDYMTSVVDGGFYGWPYCYWGQTVDDRVPQDPAMVAKAIRPDYALGGHTASLGLCWMPAGTLPGFDQGGMVIGQHGSWNRSTLAGYRVIFVPFENGKPSGEPRIILNGFLSDDEKYSYGRPVGVTIGPDGSLLVADDVGNAIWRVTGA